MLNLALLAILQFAQVLAYDNGLAATPPMGWSTWCTNDICGLRDKCTEWEVRRRADALVDQGMSELGYQWMLLDDCWADHERDSNGNLQPAPKQFPSGMKALVDYVHGKGLKLGLYTCVGTKTCKKNRPGSYGYYQQDADLFASWGVDMVKADNCNKPGNETTQSLYTQLSQALNATGHPMLCKLALFDSSLFPNLIFISSQLRCANGVTMRSGIGEVISLKCTVSLWIIFLSSTGLRQQVELVMVAELQKSLNGWLI